MQEIDEVVVVCQYKRNTLEDEPSRHVDSVFSKGSRLQRIHAGEGRVEKLRSMHKETNYLWFTLEMEDL